MTGVSLKRVHDPVEPADGYRVLVDRVWPRGLRKEDIAIAEWLRDVAPTTELRGWFDHDRERWDEFVRRYHAELDGKSELVEHLLDAARNQTVTLCFAARDREYNNAVALKRYLDGCAEAS